MNCYLISYIIDFKFFEEFLEDSEYDGSESSH